MTRRAHTEWTTEEQEVLADLYPDGGLEACAKALPDRSRTAISSRIGFLGLRMSHECHYGVNARKGYLGNAAARVARHADLDHRALAAVLGTCGGTPASMAGLPVRVHRITGGA